MDLEFPKEWKTWNGKTFNGKINLNFYGTTFQLISEREIKILGWQLSECGFSLETKVFLHGTK